MSVLGNLIVILLTAGATYFAMTSMGMGGRSGPLTLSPEIQKYVDGKLANPTGGAGAELQKLNARVAEFEKKLAEIEKIKAAHEQLAGKSDLIESAIGEQRRRREESMAAARVTEMSQLRNDIATVCAGVTIKRVQGNAKSSSPDANAFRENIGAVGERGGGGGGGGGKGQGQGPQWLQNMKARRRGGGGPGGGGAQAPGPAPASPQAPAPAPGGP